MPVASLAAVNLAPGRAAPDGSTTMPSMAPWFPWGHTDGESSEKARKNAREQHRRAVRVSEIFTAVSPSECGRNFCLQVRTRAVLGRLQGSKDEQDITQEPNAYNNKTVRCPLT